MTVSVLGLGAMGARMAARLLDAGHTLTVWNRSPDRAASLSEQGATVAATPREAAAASEVVLAMITDDEASRAVWHGDEGALAGLAGEAVAIEASTLTIGWVEALAEKVEGRGVAFVEAPVVGSRPQAEAGMLGSLVGGDAEVLRRVRPVLDAYSGAVHHVGSVGHGAAMKLAVNALFATQVAAVAEWHAALTSAGVDEARVVETLTSLPVTSPAAGAALGAIARSAFDPLFPIDLVEKDLRYALDLIARADSDGPMTGAVQTTFARAQDEGYGSQNITAIARLFR